MNIAQRFSLLVKGSITSLFDSLEDPEKSLNQLVIDMEEQLEHAKRATAQAMANEERLRARIERQEKEGRDWEQAAQKALAKGKEDDAREALRRAERAERQAERLREQLAAQSKDTEAIRESVARMNDQLESARERLHVLHARMRQSEARRAMGKVLRGVEGANLSGELERLGERVERRAAAEAAYLRLGDEMTGDDLKRRLDAADVDDAVDDRLARLRERLEADASGEADAEGETAA